MGKKTDIVALPCVSVGQGYINCLTNMVYLFCLCSKALITALFKTMRSLTHVIILMLLLMFIFSVIGHEYFGDEDTGDPVHWGDLGSAFFTLFSLVTVCVQGLFVMSNCKKKAPFEFSCQNE